MTLNLLNTTTKKWMALFNAIYIYFHKKINTNDDCVGSRVRTGCVGSLFCILFNTASSSLPLPRGHLKFILILDISLLFFFVRVCPSEMYI